MDEPKTTLVDKILNGWRVLLWFVYLWRGSSGATLWALSSLLSVSTLTSTLVCRSRARADGLRLGHEVLCSSSIVVSVASHKFYLRY